ncbi:DUF6302 family protein [Streptomyces sp. NPDC060031]|uniref:DUF6302 family protein n=1 Tax=Streptomyces sp. NPDC060031 TaxID=3347043 RepID=UPI00368C0934
MLPASQAYDFEYIRTRLADPSVLEHSVAIRVFRAPLLAIAVGGPRLGGYFLAAEPIIAMSVVNLLTGRYGFPNLRLSWSSSPHSGHAVEWGDTPPHRGDHVQYGRFYGYAEAAISAYSRPPQTRELMKP